jgi:hypothetical protein
MKVRTCVETEVPVFELLCTHVSSISCESKLGSGPSECGRHMFV